METLRYKTHTFNNNGAHDVHRYPRSAERRLFISALHRKHGFSVCVCSPDGAHLDESTPDASQAIYAEFDDDFEDEELAAPIGKCTAMYNFPGMSSDGSLSRVSAGMCIYI